jgi:krueppel-like factor 15
VVVGGGALVVGGGALVVGGGALVVGGGALVVGGGALVVGGGDVMVVGGGEVLVGGGGGEVVVVGGGGAVVDVVVGAVLVDVVTPVVVGCVIPGSVLPDVEAAPFGRRIADAVTKAPPGVSETPMVSATWAPPVRARTTGLARTGATPADWVFGNPVVGSPVVGVAADANDFATGAAPCVIDTSRVVGEPANAWTTIPLRSTAPREKAASRATPATTKATGVYLRRRRWLARDGSSRSSISSRQRSLLDLITPLVGAGVG